MNKNGFSLLELLVVIAVIALLSSITLPALQQGRKKGHQIVCASNLRQIGMAAAIYQQENQVFPQGFCSFPGYGNPPTGMQGHASYDQQGWWWFDFMADSLNKTVSVGGTLWCPSRRIFQGSDTNYVLCGNYGVNTSICRIASISTKTEFVGPSCKVTEVSLPQSKLLFMDSGYSLISWKALSRDINSHPFEAIKRQNVYYLPGAPVNRDLDIHPDHLEDALNGRHANNMINAAYADGHVDKSHPDDLAPDFDNEGSPFNYSAWTSFKKR